MPFVNILSRQIPDLLANVSYCKFTKIFLAKRSVHQSFAPSPAIYIVLYRKSPMYKMTYLLTINVQLCYCLQETSHIIKLFYIFHNFFISSRKFITVAIEQSLPANDISSGSDASHFIGLQVHCILCCSTHIAARKRVGLA